ncbi:MAG: aspartate-semialdehyde dehydrogenase [Gemmatimonadota bacterium]
MTRIPVSILGATGTVGQKFVRLLDGHPWFEVVALAASEHSAGKRYGDVVRWREPVPIPAHLADLVIRPCAVPLEGTIAFSALDNSVAGTVERAFAAAGKFVVTNASHHRMHPLVPLVVPEINADHLGLLAKQRATERWTGAVVANPNCTTIGLVLALAPLHQAFGVTKLVVSTMQAISGSGYPGVPSLDILGNVIPFISHEEEKVEAETRKILGTLGDFVADAPIAVSAHTNRVPVIDGHTETVSVALGERVTPEQAAAVWRAWTGRAEARELPSTPKEIVAVDERPDRPQPRLDIERGRGMTVTVGRVRPCPVFDLRFVLLSHNTVRGAAGAAIQNAELLVAQGIVSR